MVNYRFNEALREIDPTSINCHCQFLLSHSLFLAYTQRTIKLKTIIIINNITKGFQIIQNTRTNNSFFVSHSFS